MIDQVYLSRRNLLTLLSKLDRKMAGEETQCMIIKNDNTHFKYPQTMRSIAVTALEDEEYYIGRDAGGMHPADEQKRAPQPQSAWPFPTSESQMTGEHTNGPSGLGNGYRLRLKGDVN